MANTLLLKNSQSLRNHPVANQRDNFTIVPAGARVRLQKTSTVCVIIDSLACCCSRETSQNSRIHNRDHPSFVAVSVVDFSIREFGMVIPENEM